MSQTLLPSQQNENELISHKTIKKFRYTITCNIAKLNDIVKLEWSSIYQPLTKKKIIHFVDIILKDSVKMCSENNPQVTDHQNHCYSI